MRKLSRWVPVIGGAIAGGIIALVIANTMVKHAVSGGEYTSRRAEVEEAAAVIARHRPEVRLLLVQHGRRDAELPVCLLSVAVPAGQLRLRQGQLGQRVRPRDPVRVPLRLGHGRRA